MKHFNKNSLKELPKLKRATLINGISGVKSLNLLGSISESGVCNLAVFNSIVHIGSNPPMLGFILRPTTVERHTYQNFIANQEFTVNSVQNSFYEKAHQTSASYTKEESEFEKVGLKPQFIDKHKAPFVEDSKIKIACRYKNEYLIEENGCRLIIGEITDVYLDDALYTENGFVNLANAEVSGAIGLDAYVSLSLLDRLDYARPGEKSKSLIENGS